MSHLLLDKPEEACGLFGVYGRGRRRTRPPSSTSDFTPYSTAGRRARGLSSPTGKMSAHKDMGLVSQVFNREIIQSLEGRIGIGHVRYSPAGAHYKGNTQPLFGRCSRGDLAVAHNGSLVNAAELRWELMAKGSIFQTTTDTEIIMNLFAGFSNESLVDAVVKTVERLAGAFSLVMISGDTLIGVRIPTECAPLPGPAERHVPSFLRELCLYFPGRPVYPGFGRRDRSHQ